MGLSRPFGRHQFEVVIICALPLEADAVRSLFDHCWDDEGPPFGKAPGDANAYTTGSIGRCHVVLVHTPGIGKVNAAVASQCRVTFPGIKLAIVAGIAGAVPLTPSGAEIVLGDVLISTGIVEYDYGRRFPDSFERRTTPHDVLGRPGGELRALLRKLETLHPRRKMQKQLLRYLDELGDEPELEAEYPGITHDLLFEPTYRHIVDGQKCQDCGCDGELVVRRRLAEDRPQPHIHFGLVGSDDAVMKSAQHRDTTAQREGIIGFEMEAVGVWDTFPCVVIKGACDYADSHKMKNWQRYAAATAAACTKAFLDEWKSTPGTYVPVAIVPERGACQKALQREYCSICFRVSNHAEFQKHTPLSWMHIEMPPS